MKRWFARILARWLWRTHWAEGTFCGGSIRKKEGLFPCTNRIKGDTAVKVDFCKGLQHYEMYFCSLKCLVGWYKEITSLKSFRGV